MKVFYTLSSIPGCYYVRCLMPMIAGGWDGDATSLRGMHYTPEKVAQACLDADVVVFHRPNDQRCLEIAKLLKKQGKKIVMDNDDTYKDLDGHKWQYLLNKVDSYLDKFAREADLITCTTEFLAKEYKQLNDNVVVLPNCVDPDAWPKPLKNQTGKVRLGVVGSTAYEDLAEFKKVLIELKDRQDIQLVLFGLPPKNEDTARIVQPVHKLDYEFWESLNVEWQPMVRIEDYFDTLNDLRLDVMLIPRVDRYFNRCKSNLKFLEASMLEIPVIAQGFTTGDSPYQGEQDSKRMRVVVDNEKWLSEIELLVSDKELREEMGRKAKNYVLSKYSIDNNIQKWEEAYSKLLK